VTTQELLYCRHPALGKLFSRTPIYLGIFLSFSWTILLFGSAAIVGVLTIPTVLEPPHNGTGILARANWSLMYPVILPFLFGVASWISGNLVTTVERLTWPENKIILTKDGQIPTDYAAKLSDFIFRRAGKVGVVLIVLVVLIFIADTKDIFYGVWRHSRDADYQFPVWDWSVAYAMHPAAPGWTPPSLILNLGFDFIAYAVEASAIFLGFYWIVTFWLFLKGVCDLMIPEDAPFKFNPMWEDPSAVLGLAPLGRAFNSFLFQSLAFEAYIFFHRIQMIEWRGGAGSARQLFADSLRCSLKFDLACILQSNRWDAVDNGLWLLLICLSLPIIIISYLPLWQLRNYITRQKNSLFDSTERVLNDALEHGNEVLASKLTRKKQALEDASIWPNGQLVGWALFGSTCVLAFAAWFPALLLPVGIVALAGLILGGMFWTVFKIVTKKETSIVIENKPTQITTTVTGSNNNTVVNVADLMKDVTQTIRQSPTLAADDQKTLQKLMGNLTDALKPAADAQPDDVKRVVNRAQAVTTELASAKPDNNFLKVSLEGLKDAAAAVSAIAPTILTVVGEIVAFATKTIGS
jgi:hypothetical protein